METTTLPEPEEMSQRLEANSVTRVTPALHPAVIAHLAGAAKTGPGLVTGIGIAFQEYLTSLGPVAMFVQGPLWEGMPNWIEALVDEPNIHQDALSAWHQARAHM